MTMFVPLSNARWFLHFFFFFGALHSMWDLSSLTRD